MPQINKLKKSPRKTENSESRLIRHKFYNLKKWEKLRLAKLLDQPLCEICLEQSPSIVTMAEDVHHIVSFMSVYDPIERMALFIDYSNLQSICKSCHSKIHNNNQYNN